MVSCRKGILGILLIGVFQLTAVVGAIEPKGSHSDLPQPTPFSVQMHSLMGSFEYHKQSIDRIAKMGIRQVRDECFWSTVEEEKGRYKIRESVLRNLDYSLSKGIDTLIILDYANPHYENGNAPTKKESLEAFGKYSRALAHELRGKVKYFEVWNEPNVDGFWRPKHDPIAYANLLKVAYREVKRGNPNAVVVGLCTSGIPEDFIHTVLSQGTYDSMDVLSIHPYCHPRSPEEDRMFEKIEKLHESLKKYGEPKDIWITEIGFPTHVDGGVSESVQAEYLARIYLLSLSVPYVKTVFWYWFGPDGPDETWAEDRFGLWHQDYSPKPSGTYYANVIRAFGGAEFVRSVSLADDVRCLVFQKKPDGEKEPQQWITAIWSVEDFPQIAISTKYPLDILSAGGNETKLRPRQSKCYLSLSSEPLFISSPEELEIALLEASLTEIDFETGSNRVPRGFSVPIKISTPACFGACDLTLLSDGKNLVTSGTKRLVAPIDAALGRARFNIELKEKNAKSPFACYTAEVEIVEPIEIEISPLPPRKDERVFILTLKNATTQRLSGTAKIRADDEVRLSRNEIYFKLSGQGSKGSFPISILSKHPEDKVHSLNAEVSIEERMKVSAEKIISFARCCRASKPIKIDGVLNDWDKLLNAININRQEQYTGGYVKWGGPEDSSVKLYTSWDKQYIYFAVEFHDDILSDPVTGAQVYNNDGVELYFDIDHQGDINERRYSEDDHQYGLFITQGKEIVWSWSQLGDESTSSQIAVNRMPKHEQTISGDSFKGMIIEAAIPLAELKLEPYDGKHIGFCAAFTDDDDPSSVHPFFQEIQMTWTAGKNAWSNPQAFADLFFTDCAPRKGTVKIENAQCFVNGELFLPFGFWTYGWDEEEFYQLHKKGINAIGVDLNWWRAEFRVEGEIDAKHMRRWITALDLARKYNIKVLVQPKLGAPRWLVDKNHDLWLRKANGEAGVGNFIWVCPDKAIYREYIKRFLKYLIPAIRDHPAVLAYCLWNEPALKGDVCYCEETRRRFNDYLREKYGTIAKLQETWQIPISSFDEVLPVTMGDKGSIWADWMEFRQKNFLEFFRWESDLIRELDPAHPITIKSIWMPLDSRHAWASATRLDYWAQIVDVLGNDPYPHPNESFTNRWIADALRSAAPQRPRWYLEYNRAFVRERGVATPEEIRSWTYAALSRGMTGFFYFFYPMNRFNPSHGDNCYALRYSDTLEFLPAGKEIVSVASELSALRPFLVDASPLEPRIAILHSWQTMFQHPGEMFSTANETTAAELLYRLQYPLDFITEVELKTLTPEKYKLLIVTGTISISDDTVRALERFHERGGFIIACARFASEDGFGEERKEGLPRFFGVKVKKREKIKRNKNPIADFQTVANLNNRTSHPLTIKRYRYSSTSLIIKEDFGSLRRGDIIGSGDIIGFEDMKVEDEFVESIEVRNGAVVATFEDSSPAVVLTPRTFYIARDLSWCDRNMAKLLHEFLERAGVEQLAYAKYSDGSFIDHIDVSALHTKKDLLLFFTNSPRLYDYDGSPINAVLGVKSDGILRDPFTSQLIRTVRRNAYQEFNHTFQPGESKIVLVMQY